MTVLEVIKSATGYLEKNGVESPRLSAEHLLAHALGVKRLQLYLFFDRPVSEDERAPLRDWVRRRSAGEPLQHLLGEWDFYGRPFATDARALIPRPETELLVDRVLADIPAEGGQPVSLLDVGTGTGALALTFALERPSWSITAGDLSEEALALARENAARHGLSERIQWFHGDLLPPQPPPGGWQVLVSNPPYIPEAEIERLSREVRHDPVLALAGGADGLEVVRRLIRAAVPALAPGARLFLEIGQGQADQVKGLLREAGFSEVVVTPDYADIPRVVQARFFGAVGNTA